MSRIFCCSPVMSLLYLNHRYQCVLFAWASSQLLLFTNVEYAYANQKSSYSQLAIGGNSDSNRRLLFEENETSALVNTKLTQSFRYTSPISGFSSSLELERQHDMDNNELSYNDYNVAIGANRSFQRFDFQTNAQYREDSTLVSEVENTGWTTANKDHKSTYAAASLSYRTGLHSNTYITAGSRKNWYEDNENTSLLDYRVKNLQVGFRLEPTQRHAFDSYVFTSVIENQDSQFGFYDVLENEQATVGIGFSRSWEWDEVNQFSFSSSRQKTDSQKTYVYAPFQINFKDEHTTLNTQYRLSWKRRFERSSFESKLENIVQDQANGFNEKTQLTLSWKQNRSATSNWGTQWRIFQNQVIVAQPTQDKRLFAEVDFHTRYAISRNKSLNCYIKYRTQQLDQMNSQDIVAESIRLGFSYQINSQQRQ